MNVARNTNKPVNKQNPCRSINAWGAVALIVFLGFNVANGQNKPGSRPVKKDTTKVQSGNMPINPNKTSTAGVFNLPPESLFLVTNNGQLNVTNIKFYKTSNELAYVAKFTKSQQDEQGKTHNVVYRSKAIRIDGKSKRDISSNFTAGFGNFLVETAPGSNPEPLYYTVHFSGLEGENEMVMDGSPGVREVYLASFNNVFKQDIPALLNNSNLWSATIDSLSHKPVSVPNR